MKSIPLTILTVAVYAALGAAGVSAQDIERSRAEVVAELNAARASGQLAAMNSEDSGSAWLAQQARASAPTRSEVVAQAQRANARGEIAAFTGEDSGSFWIAAHTAPSTLTRAEVLAEMFDARARGEITAMNSEDSGAFYLARRDARRDADIRVAASTLAGNGLLAFVGSAGAPQCSVLPDRLPLFALVD